MTRGLLAIALLLSACQETQAPPAKQLSQITAFQGMPKLPQGPIAAQPWAQEPCKPEHLACVQGVGITKERFEATQKAQPPGTPAPAILQALIDEQLLAAAAKERGLWSAWLAPLQRKAMVARLLEKTQEEALTPAKIADADIQTAYRNPKIRMRYDHATAYFVTDVQLLCCKGDWRQCVRRDDVRACLDKTAPQAEALYQVLAADPAHSAEELKARVELLREQFPLIAVQDVEFWYDKSKTYEQQKGYDQMVKEFALPVVEMKPGELHLPIRSPFGWHIPRMARTEPESHKPWNDPQVRKEIAENVINAVRDREVQHYAFGLLGQYGVKVFYEQLDKRF